MAARPDPTRARRGGREPRYSVDQVFEVALALIDAEGLHAFSMRRLAEQMGTPPMTLYGYVRTKDEILDGITGLALHGLFDDLDPEAPWDEQLRTAIRDLHEALQDHPGVLELLLAKPTPSPQLDLVRETLLQILRRAGFDEDAVWESVGVLGSYAIGFASSQVSYGHVEPAVDRLLALDRTVFPNLAELAHGYPSHLSRDAFERGLTYLIDGLRRELAATAGT